MSQDKTPNDGPWALHDRDFLPFHPQASHVSPEFRDGWNACYKVAAAHLERTGQSSERAMAKAAAEKLDKAMCRNGGDVMTLVSKALEILDGDKPPPECTGQSVTNEAALGIDQEKQMLELIQQRDHREEIIDALCDAVLGEGRTEWSSGYYFEDAVAEVLERMEEVDARAECRAAATPPEAEQAEAARKAPASVPSGYALVPLEPTEAMLTAAARASMQHLLDCINDPAKADQLGSEENVRKTHASRYRSMLAAALSAGTYLQPEDLAALQRFNETAQDDGSYDISKYHARRLAEFGVLTSAVGGRYSITAFGRLCLGEDHSRLPLETVEECNARLGAEHSAALAAQPRSTT